MTQNSQLLENSLNNISKILKEDKSILINGDATEVLEKIKDYNSFARLILIDPPYNRRTRFHHYTDSLSSDKWISNLNAHCSILYNLLSKDGSLWMHIDDSELPRARIMLDNLFGPSNFIASIVWQKSVSRDNRTPISTTHEYILVYAKDKSTWHHRRHKLSAKTDQLNRYKNPDNDPRGAWSSGDITAKAGPGRRKEQFYDLKLPSGRIVTPSTGTSWRYTKERLQELIEDNRIDFGKGNKMPRLKRFLSEVEPGLVPDTWWSGKEVGTADSAKRHLKSMFPNLIPFETPKPEELTSRIIEIASDPNDLVMDIYAGSGTTAAVAQKMGRKWLTVEKQKRTFEEFTLPRLELVKKGDDLGGVSEKYKRFKERDFVVLKN